MGCRGRDTGSNSPLPDRVVPRDVPHSWGIECGPVGRNAGAEVPADLGRGGTAKEGAQMVLFLILAGLLLWATGHMVLR